MVEEPSTPAASTPGWQPRQLAVVCVLCLATGGVAGYLLRGSAPRPVQTPAARAEAPVNPQPAMGESAGQKQAQQMPHKMPTLGDMKRMADRRCWRN
jgi:hypothetical protein